MGIKLGNIDAKYIKVGSDDCKVYLGDTLLYPSSPTPPTPTYQWVLYNEGDTVQASLVYGVKLYTSLNYDYTIEFSVDGDTGVAFIYDYANNEWTAIDMASFDPIDISGYFDGDNCYTILFSDIGYGGMPISSPPPSSQFEFDIDLYEQI